MSSSINRIKEYFVNMEMHQGRWVIIVKYRPRWGAYASDDGRIEVGPDEKVPDVWWYYAKEEDVDVDEIIDLIDETVQTNMEAIKKVELFKLKATELKEIFSNEELSFKKLQTLKFVFDDTELVEEKPKKAAKGDVKKAATSKKNLMTQVGEEIFEHDVFNSRSSVVEEKTPVKQKKGKATTVKAVEMSKEEIDELRG